MQSGSAVILWRVTRSAWRFPTIFSSAMSRPWRSFSGCTNVRARTSLQLWSSPPRIEPGTDRRLFILDGSMAASMSSSQSPTRDRATSRSDLKGAASAFTGVGRYLFLPEVFAAIDEVEATQPRGKELDDIPIMQLLLRRGTLTGCRIHGDFLDVGLPSGYRDADKRLTRRKS